MYVFGPQLGHTDAPEEAAMVPGRHGVQAVKPVMVAAEPGLQGGQTVAPVVPTAVPSGQKVQIDAPTILNRPAAQIDMVLLPEQK